MKSGLLVACLIFGPSRHLSFCVRTLTSICKQPPGSGGSSGQPHLLGACRLYTLDPKPALNYKHGILKAIWQQLTDDIVLSTNWFCLPPFLCVRHNCSPVTKQFVPHFLPPPTCSVSNNHTTNLYGFHLQTKACSIRRSSDQARQQAKHESPPILRAPNTSH